MSSETRKKKEKRTYTEEDLKKALNENRENNKSKRLICKEYAIPKTTILDKISGRRPDGVKKLGPEPALGVESTISLPSFLPTESLIQPASATTQKKMFDSFKYHLMQPEVSNKARKNNQRTPASISSAAWRKYYEDKEQTKNKKQELIRKRKLERLEKQEQKKTLKHSQTVHKTAPKRKKKIQEVTQETVNEEFEKENLPAVERVKCSKGDDILISDVEDDDEKNIGCDKCIKWYHLKCTRFVGLSYLEVKDKSFEYDLCYKLKS